MPRRARGSRASLALNSSTAPLLFSNIGNKAWNCFESVTDRCRHRSVPRRPFVGAVGFSTFPKKSSDLRTYVQNQRGCAPGNVMTRLVKCASPPGARSRRAIRASASSHRDLPRNGSETFLHKIIDSAEVVLSKFFLDTERAFAIIGGFLQPYEN